MISQVSIYPILNLRLAEYIQIKMPFLYRMEIKESLVEGKGLFALEDIPEGVTIWKFECEEAAPIQGHIALPNKSRTKEQMEIIQDKYIMDRIFTYGFYYADGDTFIEMYDGGQFTNHSTTPNSLTVFPPSRKFQEIKVVSLKDIKKGEQICESYTNYPSLECEWLIKLLEKHNPDRLKIEKILVKNESQCFKK